MFRFGSNPPKSYISPPISVPSARPLPASLCWRLFVRRIDMKKVSNKTLLNVLLGTGLYLLDPLRDRARDLYETGSDRAKDAYEVGSKRVRHASEALQGEDSHAWSTVGALLLG